MSEFSHLDRSGNANMVDVTTKAVTTREARAEAYVYMNAEALRAFRAPSRHHS